MISRRLLRIKVLKEVYSSLSTPNSSPDAAQKELEHSIRRTYDLYHHLMQLVVELSDYARQQLELGKQKKRPTEEEANPNTKFIDNQFVELIGQNKPLKQYCEKQKLAWTHHPEVVKKLLPELYAADFFKQYMASPERSFTEDKNLVITLYTELLEDFEPMLAALEEQSIYWIDDVEFTLSQVIKTFKTFKQGQSPDTPTAPLYKDKEDEKFATQLLQRAITCSAEYRELIDKHTKNWDVERIAFMDIVIMVTALAELVEFPNIPVKVSLNEYIEISKYYSTPNSSVFINGVLDKAVDELKKGKLIAKNN